MANPETFVTALQTPSAYSHPVAAIRVVETHISWVFLTGQFAYKVKKSLDLGFLDFSTLAARRAACDEEIRLNRRLAASLYLDVVAITGDPARPQVGGDGEPFEYAVQMWQFPAAATLDAQLAAGKLTVDDASALAETIAEFHTELEAAPADSDHGRPAGIWSPIDQSLAELAELAPRALRGLDLDALRAGIRARFESAAELLATRRERGCVRECHGDLHLANLVRLESGITAFDALEFDPALRWIDVMSEVAFPLMDLCARERSDLGFAFLNRYVEITGDFGGLGLLPLFVAYRALVRAKVRALSPKPAGPASTPDLARLLELVAAPLPGPPCLVVTCGLSGSGKTYLSRQLARRLPALHLRSDVERKRLFGLDETARSGADTGTGMYAPDASQATYRRLAELAGLGLRAGFSVIVDAACIEAGQRRRLLAVARAQRVPGTILECRAGAATLDARLRARAAEARDASEADSTVLAWQRQRFEPPSRDEADALLVSEADSPPVLDDLVAALRAVSSE